MLDLDEDTLKRVNVIFEDLFDLSPEDRERQLMSYEDSNEILELVRQLLINADRTTSPLSQTAYELIAQEGQAFSRGDVVGGRYTIVEEIGQGGMGIVYKAERSDGQFKRAMALKSIRPLAMADELMGSFLREIHLLASLEHPNICRLYDAGTTNEGNPYMVMELIEGVSFDDTKTLGLVEWLDMFIALCEGVSYAHSRGVIHGDLKPKNIRIDQGDRPIILDFGIASLIGGPPATDMTLAYASPEQVAGAPLDTRSDIYSLGVILSSRVMMNDDRELKAIARKAIAEKADERYQTVEAFSGDISRYLDNYPISALPSSPGYVASKLFKRHRGIASAVGVGLLAVLTLLAFFLVRINNAQKETVEARNQALLDARTANELLQFQQSMLYGTVSHNSALRDLGSDKLLRDTIVLQQFVENVAAKASEDLTNNPDAHRQMVAVIGDVMSRMGQHDKADSLFRVALEIEGASLASKAQLHRYMSEHEALKSDRLLAEAYADSSVSLYTFLYGDEHIETVRSRLKLGKVYWSASKLDEAHAIFTEALPLLERHKDEVDNEVIDSRWTYGNILVDLERFAEADSLFTALYDLVIQAERIDHGMAGGIADARAYSFYVQQRPEACLEILYQALDHTKKEFGSSHIDVAVRLNNIAVLHRTLGNNEKALELYDEALQTHRSLAFPDTFEIAQTLINVGRMYGIMGKYETGNQHVMEALSYKPQIIRRDSFRLGAFMIAKMEVDLNADRYNWVLENVNEARELLFTRTPPDYMFTNRLLVFEILALYSNQQAERAYALFDQFSTEPHRKPESDIMSRLGVRILVAEATDRQAEADSLRMVYQTRLDSTGIRAAPYVDVKL